MKRALVVSLLMVWGTICFAQDPGLPDTVSFGPWEALVPVDSPWTGNIRVPVRVFNDEPLVNLELVFQWSGPWTPVEAKFTGYRRMFIPFGLASIDTQFHRVIISAE